MQRIEWSFMGELIPDQTSTTKQQVQDDLDAKCQAVIEAYSEDYKDIGFYKDNGALTSFYLATDHGANMSGNLVSHCTFPYGDRAEYAGKRTFAAGVYADFADVYSQILDYSDSMTMQGDGSPIYHWKDTANGPIVSRQYPSSFVTYIHQGYSVAFDAWPLPVVPLASGENYLGNLTTIRHTSPKKFANYAKWGIYRVDWRYVYRFPAPQGLRPTLG
jgi:hypothetical protein